jgi:hypothetical protein
MQISISDKAVDTCVDLATIIGVGIAGWGNTVHVVIASLVGVTLIIKNFYDILIKREEKRRIQIENKKNEKNIIIP